MNARSMVILSLSVVLLVIGLFATTACVEWLDAKHVMVIQYPSGDMAVFTEPGPKPQWFGTATKYARRVTYSFSNSEKCQQREKDAAVPFKVQFNDGGIAELCGSLQYEMPTKPELLVRIQKDYANEEAVSQQLVQKALNNAVYFSGPMMSSIESSAERKPELLQYIEDQAKNGVYQMQTESSTIKDPITGVDRTVNVVKIVREKGVPLRNAQSAIGEYGIMITQLAISEIHYDDVVKGQIKTRQDAINQVQVAIANAKRAEQDALTIAKQGEATAAKAKWDQETIKAKAVTEAQQKLEVATLAAKAAEQTKREQILLGEGEAERRKLVMSADGALDKKLEALVKINELYATAIKDYKGNWVPNVSMGQTSGTNQGLALVDLLTAKTARDLGVDMGVSGKGQTGK